MSDRSSSGEVLLAFILGGLVGAAFGLLYAPRSGKETRQRLRDISEDITDKIGNLTDDVRSKATQAVNDGKDRIISSKERLEEAFEAGRKAFERKPTV